MGPTQCELYDSTLFARPVANERFALCPVEDSLTNCHGLTRNMSLHTFTNVTPFIRAAKFCLGGGGSGTGRSSGVGCHGGGHRCQCGRENSKTHEPCTMYCE